MREFALKKRGTDNISCVYFVASLCLCAFSCFSFLPGVVTRIRKLNQNDLNTIYIVLVIIFRNMQCAIVRIRHLGIYWFIIRILLLPSTYKQQPHKFSTSNAEVFHLFCTYTNTFVMTPFIPSRMLKKPPFNTVVYDINVKGSHFPSYK